MKKLCIGCRYCVQACPFDVPVFDHERNRVVQKCTFCFERIEAGLKPACVETCPAEALKFFLSYEDLAGEAEAAKARGLYVYGLDEVGGLRWAYISDVPFEKLGFPEYARERYAETATATLLQTGAVGVVGGLVVLGLSKYAERRRKVEEEKRKKAAER